ncbi:cutinase transcription factor 1 [Naviculisporaceae sp. PSN 640]
MSENERETSASASPPDTGNDYSGLPQTTAPDASPGSKTRRGASPKHVRIQESLPEGQKQTKRRAARACAQCRQRKVRCNVVEQNPCANCTWDKCPCVVQESRRRKKATYHSMVGYQASGTGSDPRKNMVPLGVNMAPQQLRMATTEYGQQGTGSGVAGGMGVPDPAQSAQVLISKSISLCFHVLAVGIRAPIGLQEVASYTDHSGCCRSASSPSGPLARIKLPRYIKPLPSKLSPIEINYLYLRGALLIPSFKLQKALLRAYVEYVHPYMPLLPLFDVLKILGGQVQEQGPGARIGLFLYQAIMFVSVAFVDEQYLHEDGYPSRREARKAFFWRVRLLYDHDFEPERHVLVQGLLMMSYWYETPDEQKDTWYWMGVAVSIAHTIGLHRNPATLATLDLRKQRLFKRMWWSCFMRDRLIALGMRRPTRIQFDDTDVPMLEESDFEIETLPDGNQFLGPHECKFIRDTGMQRQLALMCIEKAKLCVIISRVLKTQYSVLSRDGMHPNNTTASTMMLFPNKSLENVDRIQMLDDELIQWHNNLPDCCRFQDVTEAEIINGDATVALHRTLLHMLYRATVAALHRPQFQSAQAAVPGSGAPACPTEIQTLARRRVHESARLVMNMVAQLRQFKLDRYLPTTGVTAILPAMLIQMFEMKSPNPQFHEPARKRFCEGMAVFAQLKQSYAAAEFAAKFLEQAYIRLQLGPVVAFQQRHNIDSPADPGSTVEMMGHMADFMGPEAPAAPRLTLPTHGGFLSGAEMHSPYQDHPGLPRDYSNLIVEPPLESLTPPSSDQSEEQFERMTPESDESEQQTALGLTAAMGAGADASWESYQQMGMDSDLEVSQWLQFPAEAGGIMVTTG